MATLRLQLEKSVGVAHHPVLANRALALQPENPLQFRGARRATVIVLRLGRRAPKSVVVFRQIFPLQIHVGHLVTADILPPQLFHQTVLMRAVNPFHAPLGLRRTGGDQLDPQLRAHAPRSCSWRHPPCRSNSPPDHAPPARRENSRPTAPVPQSAPCAGVDADADAASVRDSITPPPTSSVAAFRHAPA